MKSVFVLLAAAVFTAQPSLQLGLQPIFRDAAYNDTPPVLHLDPVVAPDLDRHSDSHLVPAGSHRLSYASPPVDGSVYYGSVNSSVSFKYPAVALENIAALITVQCSSKQTEMTLVFANGAAVETALREWSPVSPLVLITGHGHGHGCASGGSRMFYLARHVARGTAGHSLVVATQQTSMHSVANNMQLSFASQAAHHAPPAFVQHPVIAPNISFQFDQMLPPNTTLLAWPPFVHVVSDHAYMKSSVLFSGYLAYDLDRFAIDDLYLDVVCKLDTAVQLSAGVDAAFNRSFTFASPRTSEIPGIIIPDVVTINPALAVAIDADLGATAAVEAVTGYSVQITDGHLHLDLLNMAKSGISGFIPAFKVEANASEAVDSHFNISTGLDIYMNFQVGNLVKFETSFDVEIAINNVFSLGGRQQASIGGDCGGDIGVKPSGFEHPACGEDKIQLYSEFLLGLSANNQSLYNDKKVIWDICKDLFKPKPKGGVHENEW